MEIFFLEVIIFFILFLKSSSNCVLLIIFFRGLVIVIMYIRGFFILVCVWGRSCRKLFCFIILVVCIVLFSVVLLGFMIRLVFVGFGGWFLLL